MYKMYFVFIMVVKKLYLSDGYTFDEYFILAMGISYDELKTLEKLCYKFNRQTEEMIKISI